MQRKNMILKTFWKDYIRLLPKFSFAYCIFRKERAIKDFISANTFKNYAQVVMNLSSPVLKLSLPIFHTNWMTRPKVIIKLSSILYSTPCVWFQIKWNCERNVETDWRKRRSDSLSERPSASMKIGVEFIQYQSLAGRDEIKGDFIQEWSRPFSIHRQRSHYFSFL